MPIELCQATENIFLLSMSEYAAALDVLLLVGPFLHTEDSVLGDEQNTKKLK
jgi:hypothetical protein